MRHRKPFKFHKALALLISFSLLLTAVLGGTFAHIIVKTPSFINTFLSGLDPSGDLIISKEVTHPFGAGYLIPDGINFTFTVSLGTGYAGKTVETSQGEIIADESGNITVTAAPDGAVRVKNLLKGTSVTVTEASAVGFAPTGGAQQSITIQAGENHIAYTNDYTPSPVTPVNLIVSGTKLLEGRDWQEGDSFTFLLEYRLEGEDDVWNKLGETSVIYELIEVTDPETDEVTWEPKPDFDKFDFSDLVRDIPYSSAGEYSFRISEIDGTIGGITYDKIVSYFDVIVGDADMNGALKIQNVVGYQNATASYDTSTGNYHVDVTVNNKYSPAGTATATIVIDKRVMSMSGEDKSAARYTFELYDENGSLATTSGETSAAGETSITLTYEAKDAEKTFHYTLKETHGGETHNGLIYADTVYPISVSIVDDLDGTISAYIYSTEEYRTELIEVEPEETEPEETVPEETEPEETEPEETEPEETEPEETEPEETEPEETEPEETEPEETVPEETEPEETEPEQTEAVETVPATISELVVEIVAEPVPLNASPEDTEATEETDGGKENTADNIVMETNSPIMEISEPQTKEVTVIPEGASSSYTVSFVNVYDPVDTSASFGGTKELTGRNLKEGEFAFDLYVTGDNFTVAGVQKPIQSVTNQADGEFAFAAIAYSKVGIYRYVVKENGSAKLGGITYNDAVFHVIVTVTDENGTLKARTSTTDDLGAAKEIKFHNSYKAAPTSVSLHGTKTLTGMELTANMFRFHLYKTDANYTIQGAALASASNDAYGQFTFDSIEYAETGTFYYLVKEDASAGIKGMTYDDTVYGIKVSVWDDGSGILKASVSLTVIGGDEVDAILFENSYIKPVEPTEPSDPTEPSEPTTPSEPTKPSEPSEPTNPSKPVDPNVPTTSDGNPTALYIVLAVISIVAIILLLITGKRKPKSRYLRD